MIQTDIKPIPEGAFNYIATRNFKHKKLLGANGVNKMKCEIFLLP